MVSDSSRFYQWCQIASWQTCFCLFWWILHGRWLVLELCCFFNKYYCYCFLDIYMFNWKTLASALALGSILSFSSGACWVNCGYRGFTHLSICFLIVIRVFLALYFIFRWLHFRCSRMLSYRAFKLMICLAASSASLASLLIKFRLSCPGILFKLFALS